MADGELRQNLKELIISSLKLELTPAEITDDAPLFGGEGGGGASGLGLDSIDALELAVAIERTYRVTIPDEKVGKQVFASVSSLAKYVGENLA